MFHQKIDVANAIALTATPSAPAPAPSIDRMARVFGALIVLALPLILLGLLARFVWKDIKAIGRGTAIFYRAVTEELSRS